MPSIPGIPTALIGNGKAHWKTTSWSTTDCSALSTCRNWTMTSANEKKMMQPRVMGECIIEGGVYEMSYKVNFRAPFPFPMGEVLSFVLFSPSIKHLLCNVRFAVSALLHAACIYQSCVAGRTNDGPWIWHQGWAHKPTDRVWSINKPENANNKNVYQFKFP